MLNIEYLGGYTSIIVRPGQVSQLVSPRYYLFKFTNKNTKVDTYMTADEVSFNPGSYQEFSIINGLTASNNMFIGDIGEYSVTILETAYQHNSNPASASNTVWLDTMRVFGDSKPTFTSYTPTASNTFTYYK